MSAGLRFGIGPLRFYIPLGRRKRKGGKKPRKPIGPVGIVFCIVFAVSFVIWNHARPEVDKPMSRDTYTGTTPWPLTADTGVLSCKNGRVLFTTGGVAYVDNPRPGDGYTDIKQIAADEPAGLLERDIEVFLSTGATLC